MGFPNNMQKSIQAATSFSGSSFQSSNPEKCVYISKTTTNKTNITKTKLEIHGQNKTKKQKKNTNLGHK